MGSLVLKYTPIFTDFSLDILYNNISLITVVILINLKTPFHTFFDSQLTRNIKTHIKQGFRLCFFLHYNNTI